MKTLELENYGVTEMSNNEMKEVDGGFLIELTLYNLWVIDQFTDRLNRNE